MSVYDTDTDEMTAGQLAALQEVRKRIVAHYAWDPQVARTAAGVVDEYATEIVHDNCDWEQDDTR